MELVLTVMANDRPGIVERIAREIEANQGNWLESRMATIAGKFAGIVRIEIPAEQFQSTQTALQNLRIEGLSITIEVGDSAEQQTTTSTVEVVGNDRPGIVREVTNAFAKLDVNVIDLQTEIEPASMSGGSLFRAKIEFALKEDQQIDSVIQSLENLSPDLMVDS